MIAKITKSDILLSIREQLEKQKKYDKCQNKMLFKLMYDSLNSPTSRAPYVMSDAVKNLIDNYVLC